MAILNKHPKADGYKTGDPVTAKIINDTIDTAIDANQKAVTAETNSRAAVTDAALAKINSETALTQSAEAVTTSATAESVSAQARDNAVIAFNKASDVEMRANRGDFNGANGVVVEAAGHYAFQVLDGDLILTYTGDTAPKFALNEDGELIYNV